MNGKKKKRKKENQKLEDNSENIKGVNKKFGALI